MGQTWLPALRHPWIMDLNATVKPIYGHQEGAEIGYNPHKPGQPSHVYHSLFVRGLRLVLDVTVHPGKQTAATHGREHLWRLWTGLPKECRPWLMAGDSSCGHEGLLAECEARGQKYLFRLRQSRGGKQLLQTLESQSGWQSAVNGWQGAEGRLQLTGWTAKRRVVGLRRLRKPRPAETDQTGQKPTQRHPHRSPRERSFSPIAVLRIISIPSSRIRTKNPSSP